MKIVSLFAVILICSAEMSMAQKTIKASKPPLHTVWNDLLHKHVSPIGKVNYKGFVKDSVELKIYLDSLSNNPPDKNTWSNEEQLAYWINAYNAFTVKLIVSHYPVKSITDLHPKFYIPLLNTVWHIKFFSIGGIPFNLDRIEHSILRKEFDEPRIHFAIVCASVSCPPLRNEAYVAIKLNDQLNNQAKLFINDAKRNNISRDKVDISKIFSWFKGDFTKNGSLIQFLNLYSNIKISGDATIDYMEYN